MQVMTRYEEWRYF